MKVLINRITKSSYSLVIQLTKYKMLEFHWCWVKFSKYLNLDILLDLDKHDHSPRFGFILYVFGYKIDFEWYDCRHRNER